LASLNEHNEIGAAQIPTLSEKIASPTKPPLSVEEETRQFVEEIRFEIQEFVEFPDSLKGKGYQATVLIEFGLNPDGTIRDLKVQAKEGQAQALFEARALLAVQKASRFFPLVPEQVDVQTLTFKIPIIFQEV
jgi:TonB family protein